MSKLKIVSVVMANLGQGDESKIAKFFETQVSTFEFNVKQLETNKQTLELQQQNTLLEIDRRIEDAKADLKSSYTDITPDHVKTNAMISSFGEVYWKKVKTAQTVLATLEKEKEDKVKAHALAIETIDGQIKLYKERIKIIETME